MKKIISLLFYGCLFFFTGCTTTPSHPRDPLEPMNRVIYKFNDKADRWVLKPVAEGYHDYTPNFFQAAVDNFFSNLQDANSALNFSLQGSGKASLYNFSRFLINSTIGVLGIFDVVGNDNRTYQQTGFGRTLAAWGWKDSSYLVIPLLGPSTLRDGVGIAGNFTFRDQVLYAGLHEGGMYLSSIMDGINTRSKLLGVEDTINGAALDPYAYTRDAWLEIRAKKTGDTSAQEEDDFDIDDLVN